MALFSRDLAVAGLRPDALLAWANSPNRLEQRWIAWAIAGLAIAFVAAAVAWYATGLLAPVLLVLVLEACCHEQNQDEDEDEGRARAGAPKP